MVLAMIGSAFVLGVAIAMPPGAVSISGGQRAITRGFWNAFVFYMGVVTADALYALLVYFGLSALVKDSPVFKLLLGD
ncbi:MAG: LysE family transporter [Anaerolineae bacterium]